MRSTENPQAGQGPVVLDVGGDVGALLVMMPASWEGTEIEIRPLTDSPEDASHDHNHSRDHNHNHNHAHQPDQPDHPHGQADQAHLAHVEVLQRPTPNGFVYCAVFPDLRQGHYELSERPFGEVALEVTIDGGQVAEAAWPLPDPREWA